MTAQKQPSTPNDKLRQARIEKGWSQQDVANKLDVAYNTVSRWELGVQHPTQYYSRKLCELFQADAEKLGLLQDKPQIKLSASTPAEQLDSSISLESFPRVWNVPYLRNPFFLGRDEDLSRLHRHLHAGQAIALSQPQAISGLGGIGKTQLALEYAYRFHQNYQIVLWVRGETRDALIASSVAIASLLRLPECEAKEQEVIVQAVKAWFQTQRDWLLILDNADDLELAADFLPPTLGGHLVLTTRAMATGRLASRLEIETLLPEQGALLLLRRAGLIAPDAPLEHAPSQMRALAVRLSEGVGGLPLALDQAGAYLEETGMDLMSYTELYRQHRATLLSQRRGGGIPDHPAPVATTWSLSFERMQEQNPAAAHLLHMMAFLSPDAIPEELFTNGVSMLDPILAPVAADPLSFNQTLEVLRAYSLLRRNPASRMLSVHRLVQAVLQDTLEQAAQRTWAEQVVLTVNAVFPHAEHATWPQCERLLAQALAAIEWIERYQLMREEAAQLLFETASYLQDRARYAEAEPFFLRALAIFEQQVGSEHPQVAHLLYRLASLYWEQGKYAEAEPLYQQALTIFAQQLGPEHPQVAYPLTGLAILYQDQDKYAEAEPLYQQALAIREQQLGPEHPKVAYPLTGLASLYWEQGKYAEAEPLYQRALTIFEQQLGPEHPQVAYPLTGLASIYQDQGKYAEAEPFFLRALAIFEQQVGSEHPDIAETLHNFAAFQERRGNYQEAPVLYQRALTIREQALGPDHPKTRATRERLTALRERIGQEAGASPQDDSSPEQGR